MHRTRNADEVGALPTKGSYMGMKHNKRTIDGYLIVWDNEDKDLGPIRSPEFFKENDPELIGKIAFYKKDSLEEYARWQLDVYRSDVSNIRNCDLYVCYKEA